MPGDKKKISVLVTSDLIRQMEDAGKTQTQTVLEALEYYFSEDREKILEYKEQILEYSTKIGILEARLAESDKFRKIIDEQNETTRAQMAQVQALIVQMENERRLQKEKGRLLEDILRQKDEKIFLLEDGKKKRKWWPFSKN